MRVLGIIPARGGSKGVPRKNIKLLCGRPLLAYTVESARNAKRLTRTILSTEDAEIAEIGKNLGVEVPFLRPKELADDASPTFPLVLHALEMLESTGDRFDAVCLLQPTNPLRRGSDIDECIHLLEHSGSDSVVSVQRVPDAYNPQWVYWLASDGRMVLSTGEGEPVTRRQDLAPAFHREGSIYVTKRSVITKYGNLYGRKIHGYEIPLGESVNIDTAGDWEKAEMQIRTRVNEVVGGTV